MSEKYAEIMNHISVTPGMRERIIRRLAEVSWQDDQEKTGNSKKIRQMGQKTIHRVRRWQSYAVAAAVLALVLTGAYFAAGRVMAPGRLTGQEQAGESTGMGDLSAVYEAVQCNSAAEVADKVGFSVSEVENLPCKAESVSYYAYPGSKMAEIIYSDGEQSITYRKSSGSEDNSGDYNSYQQEKQLAVGDSQVTLKGSAEGWQLAIWSKDGFAYSVSASKEITLEEMKDMIGSIS